jgi:tetratricopeptide (TPR) repeat protein/TolB-like protein
VRTLVLPFENLSADPTEGWRGSAFEEAISTHLFAAGHDVVDFVSRNRQLSDKGFAPAEPITRASAIVLTKDLGAERVVLGEFRVSEDRIDVTARVVDLTKSATVGVIEDHGTVGAFARLTQLVAKNVFRLERDVPPPGFDLEAERKQKIPAGALEASARARMSFDAEEQRRQLERAISLAPDYLEARFVLGRLLLEDGRAREAIDVLASVRGEGRTYEQAYFDLGLAYLESGAPASALEVFRNLAGRPDAGLAATNNLGVALMRLGRYPAATEAFESSVVLEGDSKSATFNLAWSYWRSGKGARAFDLFEKLATKNPLDAEAHLLLGAAAISQARADVAERSRNTALTLDPFLAGVDPATVEGWERVLRTSSNQRSPAGPTGWSEPLDYEEDVVALMELFDARELRSRGRMDEAILLLQRSLYRDPTAIDSRRELADIYRHEGELGQAASELSIVLWSEPSAEAHVELARVYLDMDERTKAIEQVKLALELDPENGEARGMRDEILTPEPPR